jgi:acyl transferase domain-containing protein/acyl-CoA synthetase (AMP-forming)/AMP-acid ligase II/acyl carrier protein/predicted alpha/beta-fold hydrolase
MSWKFSNFVDLLSYRALEQSGKTVFTFLPDGETEAESLTYQQLDEQARAIAAKLQSLNAKGERVLLLYPSGLEFISAFFGCLYAGAIAVPAYPPRANRSLERLQTIVSDARANLALTPQALLGTIEGRLTQNLSTEVLSCVTTDRIDPQFARDWQPFHPTEDELAFLQYTSGSTGMPKGVMVSHGNLIHNSGLINRCFQDTPESKGVSWLPPYHDMGLIGGILQPIYVGASMTLMPPVTFLQRPFRWLQAISRDRVTTSGAPNFAYDLCVAQIPPEQRDTLDLSCWELAFTGAEPVRAETLERFAEYFSPCGFRQEAFYPCYGMAETTLIVSGGLKRATPILQTFDGKALEQNQAIAPPPSENASITLVGCGQIVEGQLIIVNPETLNPCNGNDIGEIWVANQSVARGYWNRAKQTEETFNAYLADTQEGPFLRTGDLGFLQEGELFVTGRLKDLIIIRGRNHYPQDIELTVEKSHEALREACGSAFSVDVDGEERLVITYEVKRSYIRKLNVEEVSSAIRKAVVQNHELQPFAIALLKTGSIPKTSSGKIQRHACKTGFLKGSLEIVGEWRNSHQFAVGTALGNSFANQPSSDRPNSPQLAQSENSQQQSIQVWLVKNIAQRLGLSPQEIDVGEPFVSYGLDSVQVVRLSAELEDWLERKLSPTLAYDYPTIETLAQYLAAGEREIERQGEKDCARSQRLNPQSPIAIVGMGCRFPGANNPEAFWQLLCAGKDAITTVKERWEGEEWGGFLEQIDRFDPQFFGISPREAREMDPQQRLLLEVSWEALENAGIAADTLAGSATGVFIGMSSSDYSQIRLRHQLEPDAYAGTGNAHSIAANRLSYFFDFLGPSLTVDTACSSSLVAVHLAVQSLQNGECDRAIAGGVNLILAPELTQTFARAGMMAADGRCKTFDASADGYVRGEGCGAIVLKRLSDAIADGDKILALIRGSAINQDGRSNGLTAPNGLAQRAVLRQALHNAGATPAAIGYVETHGTGTSLGDPIEVNSLKTVFLEGRSPNEPLWLGSVKTNIGHLEAAAGIAGLMKMVLCLQHEAIPPHLHLNTLNPHIDLQDTPISIPTQLQPWAKGERSRLAGVSSFGFGGTNAHVVLEESGVGSRELGVESRELVERPLHLLTLSAKSETALGDLVKSYAEYLTDRPEVDLKDLCFTANAGRSRFNHCLAIATNSPAQLQEQLAAWGTGVEIDGLVSGTIQRDSKAKIAFLFTGQGSQYVGMGYQLYQTQPTFRLALERCAEILEPYLEQSLIEILYPEDWRAHPQSTIPHPQLDETAYTQPALFALEYALAQLWQSWGIEPSVAIGHSVGEYVAACIAGVFSLEDGLKLLAQRAKLMQALPGEGEMVAVFAEEATVEAAIAPYAEKVAIAAINGYQSIVISGEKEAVKQVIALLKERGIKTRKLQVSHGFHSPLMEPILAEFERIAREIQYSAPRLEIVSNLTGELAAENIATPQYWVNHIRQPVQFLSSIELLDQQGCQIFLEIGAKPTLLGMGRSILEASPHPKDYLWLPSLRPGQTDWQQILHSLAVLFVQGIKIDWLGFDRDYRRQKVGGLPTYPFQRQRYWLEAQSLAPVQELREKQRIDRDWFYQVEWQLKPRKVGQNSSLEESGSWLIFCDRAGFGNAIAQQLAKSGQHCLPIYPGERYQELDKTTFLSWEINPTSREDFQHLFNRLSESARSLKGIIHLWSLETDASKPLTPIDLEQAQTLGCGSILHLIQTLVEQSLSSRLWLITRGTQAVNSGKNSLSIAQSPLGGLSKVIALEHPEYWGGIVDLSPNPDAGEATLLVEEILESDGEDRLAFRSGKRYVARLKRDVGKSFVNPPAREFQKINSESTYLITGGLGSLGLKIARGFVQQGAKSLVLVGRSEPSERVTRTLQTLERTGAKILTIRADVARAQDVIRFLEEINASMPPLRGIIHAAGVLDDGILAGLSWERFAKVLAPKIQGTWNLHQFTQDIALDFFVMFSSVAALLGSPGQGNYAAANAFLDAIAHDRKTKGLPALSINWGPLSEGMAATKRLGTTGLKPIPTEQGIEILIQLLSEKTAQIGVIDAQWEELIQKFPDLIRSPYFQEIVGQFSNHKPSSKLAIFDQLLTMPSTQREEFLTAYLQSSLAQIMQMNGKSIAPHESLLDLGMDSLMVMEAINQLKSDLQLMLYPREFYERPQIETLAKYLAAEFEKSYGNDRSSANNSPLPKLAIAVSPPRDRVSNQPQNKLPGIAFILSSPRSGSTLLRVMLAGHQDLASPPELHLLPFATMAQRDEELTLSHLGEGLQRAFMELKGIDAPTAQNLVAELVEQDRSIDEVYALLQDLAGKRLLVDKSPTYAFHRETLERAESIFTGAKYIHLVRHPYSMIESFCRMRMDKLIGAGEGNPYQLAESIWTNTNQNILDFFEQISPECHHQIHYENLVKEPARVMQELCEFLSLPFDASVLNPYDGKRMTDGVRDRSISVGDPNFLNHRQIDPQLADTWKKIQLRDRLSETTCRVAISLNYSLPHESAIADQPLMKEEYINARGLNLCLCRWGSPQGPLVLCLHGILEQGAAWCEVAARLAERGYCVVAPDLRGHGRSDRVGPGGSYNLLDFLADIDAIVEQIADKPFILVGHSLGSVIAAMFASIRPQKVKNLVLVETVLPTEVNEGEAVQQLATHLNYLASSPEHLIFPNVAAAAERLHLATPALSQSLAMQLAERITEPEGNGVRWRWDPLLRTRAGIGFNGIDKSRYLNLLRQIEAPIALIYGDRSDFNRPEDLSEQQKAMSQATKIVLPGGHNLHLEVPSDLARIIVKIQESGVSFMA